MAKKKEPVAPPSDTQVSYASKTTEIVKLVRLAKVFVRVGARGPFEVDVPIFCAQHIEGKGFRKGNVPAGMKLQTDAITVGKRDGLIFRLRPTSELKRNGEPVEYVEMNWADIKASVSDLDEAMAATLSDTGYITALDNRLKEMTAANAAMHSIIIQGFNKALAEAKDDLDSDELQSNPLWGAF